MAQQWLSASDPYWSQFGDVAARDPESGEFTNPYISTIRGLQAPENWRSVARQLGYQGPFETQVMSSDLGEGGGGLVSVPAPEFLQFIQQRQAEGYDFVTKADQINKDRQTIGLRTPTGEVINQTPVKVSGFGDFFREFVLPSVAAYGAVNFLGPRLEGLTNALSGGGQLSAAELANMPANAMGQAGQAPAVEAVDLASMGSLPPPLSPEIQELILSETLPASAAAPAMGSLPPPLPPGIQNLISSETLPASAASRTGIPALDKAIDLVTSPAGQAVVGAAGSVAGGVMQANAAEAAANQQAEAARNALQLQREMFEYQKELLDPYRKRGEAALTRLSGALGLEGPAQPQQMLEMDPGYGFRLGEGMKALERMQAARGNMLSGGALKAGQRYAQDYASGEYQNAYNRLANIAGLGQTVGGQLGSAAQQFGTSAGNVMGQEANALAAGRIGRGSAYSGAIQGGLNAFQNYFNRQQEEKLFRDIFGRTAVGG